jgi:hypothetical protein
MAAVFAEGMVDKSTRVDQEKVKFGLRFRKGL